MKKQIGKFIKKSLPFPFPLPLSGRGLTSTIEPTKTRYLNKNIYNSIYFLKALERIINNVSESFVPVWNDKDGNVLDIPPEKQKDILMNPVGNFTLSDFIQQFAKQKILFKMVAVLLLKEERSDGTKSAYGLQILDGSDISSVELDGGIPKKINLTKSESDGVSLEGEVGGAVHIDNVILSGMAQEKVVPFPIQNIVQSAVDIELNILDNGLLNLLNKYAPDKLIKLIDGTSIEDYDKLLIELNKPDNNKTGGNLVSANIKEIEQIPTNQIDDSIFKMNEIVRDRILFALQVPKELIDGIPVGLSSLTVNQIMTNYYAGSINPILDAFVEFWNTSIIELVDPKNFGKVFLSYADTRPDSIEDKIARASKLFNDGVITRNQYLSMADLPTTDDGDVYKFDEPSIKIE